MRIGYRSIKGRIFLWFFLCNSLLLFITSLIIYNQMKYSAFRSVNNVLRSKVDIIDNFLKMENDKIKLHLNDFVTGGYAVPGSGHYYKVIIDKNNIISSHSLKNKNFNFAKGHLIKENPENKEKFFIDRGPQKEQIMIIQKEILFANIPITIFAAEDITVQLNIISSSQQILIIVFPIAIIIFGVITLFLAKVSLKPLAEFSTEVSQITHENLDKKIVLKDDTEELEDLTKSFNDMLDRIRNAFEIEKFIISEASHKLKTPVTVIKGYCDFILNKDREKSEYIDTLKSIQRVNNNIVNLIKGILSLANLDSGHLSFQNYSEVSINNSLLDAIELAKYQGEQKNINFNLYFDDDLKLFADEDKLTEAFVNIIGNAYKYNNDNGSITITTKRNNNKIEIYIADTGIGIAEKEINRIFERFYRSESVKKIDGSGLGLKIAKMIIEAHKGSISVNSKIGKGTEFKIVLNDITNKNDS